jgi:excisionase family DNA binding protein
VVQEKGKDLLTADESAILLRTTRATIYHYIKAGKIRGIKVGGRRLFTKKEIITFLGYDPFEQEVKEVEATPELKQAREELKRADGLRRQRVGQEVVDIARRVQRVFIKAGDIRELAYAQFVEGGGLLNAGELIKAAKVLYAALEKAQDVADRTLVGMINATLGMVEELKGNSVQAINNFHEALRIFRETGPKFRLASVLQNLGVLYNYQKRPLEALHYLNRAIEAGKSTKMHPGFEPRVLIALSRTYFIIGDFTRSFSYASKAWKLGVKRGDLSSIVLSTTRVGHALQEMGDLSGASEFFKLSYKNWQELGPEGRDMHLSAAINSLIAIGDYLGCLELLQRNDVLFTKGEKGPDEIPEQLLNYAKCYIGLNSPEKAIECSRDSLDKQIELGQFTELWPILKTMATGYSLNGNHRAACENYREALFYLNSEIERAHAEGLPGNYDYQLQNLREEYNREIFKHPDDSKALLLATGLMAQNVNRVVAEYNIYPDPIEGRFTARKYTRNHVAIVDFLRAMSQGPPGKLKPSLARRHQERLNRLKKTKCDLIAKLSRENPLFLPLQGEEGPSVEELKELYSQGQFLEGSSILLIHLAKNRGQGFLVGPEGIRIRKGIELGRDDIRRYLNVIINNCISISTLIEAGSIPSLSEQENIKRILTILYDNLLRPFIEDIDVKKPLILSTDGPLNLLPFNALYDGKKYVCEYLQIYKVLSPAFLRGIRLSPPEGKEKAGKLLIVSPTYLEGDSVASTLDKSLPSKRVTFRTGDKAVVEKVRPVISRYKAFLYMGGYFHQAEGPHRANLPMHHGPGLTAQDLFTQRYDLSSVQSVILYTGGLDDDETNPDDPFLPIQRAFLTAGANNVATFLWKMDNSSLEGVLSEVYSDFAPQGMMGFNAILKAQASLIRQPMTSHPYFWAGINCFSNLTAR